MFRRDVRRAVATGLQYIAASLLLPAIIAAIVLMTTLINTVLENLKGIAETLRGFAAHAPAADDLKNAAGNVDGTVDLLGLVKDGLNQTKEHTEGLLNAVGSEIGKHGPR